MTALPCASSANAPSRRRVAHPITFAKTTHTCKMLSVAAAVGGLLASMRNDWDIKRNTNLSIQHRLLPQHSITKVTNASVHSGSAWRVGRPEDVHAALNGRPLCPGLLPFASMQTEHRRTTCCPSGHGTLLKDHGIDAEEMHHQAREASKLLQGRRVLVVGDSLSVQWANALLVDLHGRGAMAGLDQLRAHAWKEQHGRRRYCDATPQFMFNGTASAPQAPILALFHVASDACNKTGSLCCTDGIETQMAALTRFMAKFEPHIVVANFGIHWHGRQVADGTYSRDVRTLVLAMVDYGAERLRRSSQPLLLYRETLPQHFPNLRRDGSFEGFDSENGSVCSSIVLGRSCDSLSPEVAASSSDASPATLNCLATRVLSDGAGSRANVDPLSQMRLVPQLLPQLAAFAARLDAHMGYSPLGVRREGLRPTALDCTHWCYSPLLWDAALGPFYRAVLNHYVYPPGVRHR